MDELKFLPVARAELKKRGIGNEELQATACADMTADGGLCNLYLALTERELVFMVSSVSGSASVGTAYRKGGRVPWETETIAETYSFYFGSAGGTGDFRTGSGRSAEG